MSKSSSNTASSLADFNFDDSQEFFGIKSEDIESANEKSLKEIKGDKMNGGGNTKEKTNLDDEPKTRKVSSKRETDDEDIEDDFDEEEVTFFKDPPEDEENEVEVKSTKKAASKKKDEEEEEDVNEEEVEVKSKKKEKKEEDEEEEEEVTVAKGKKKVEEEKKEEEDEDFYTVLAEEMKEKGIFQNVEIPKNKKLTEEEFIELQGQEIESKATEIVEALIKDLDDDAKDFMRFKQNGGKTSDFLATYSTGLSFDKFDEDNPMHVQAVLTHYMTAIEKTDPEDIPDKLKYYKDQGTDKVKAAKYFEKIQDLKEKEKDKLLKETEVQAKQKAEEAKKFSEDFSKVLEKTEEVGVFVITKADKQELNSYVNKPTVKVGKNKYIPQFNADLGDILRGATKESKQRLALLAKLVKNDFDVKDLATKVQTTVTKEARSRLKEAKKTSKPVSSGGFNKKSIADFFEDEET